MTTMNNEGPADPSAHEPRVTDAPAEIWLVYGELPPPVAWVQPDHLQKARMAPFMCRVEPTQRHADFVPIYTADQLRTAITAAVAEARAVPKPAVRTDTARLDMLESDKMWLGQVIRERDSLREALEQTITMAERGLGLDPSSMDNYFVWIQDKARAAITPALFDAGAAPRDAAPKPAARPAPRAAAPAFDDDSDVQF